MQRPGGLTQQTFTPALPWLTFDSVLTEVAADLEKRNVQDDIFKCCLVSPKPKDIQFDMIKKSIFCHFGKKGCCFVFFFIIIVQ